MKLWSTGWHNGEPIPDRYAAGCLAADGVAEGENLSPPLAWSDLPPGTQSLVLVFHDFDMPGPRVLGHAGGPELAVDVDRIDFFHWLLVDLPPGISQLEEGAWRRGRDRPGAAAPAAAAPARQGLNDFGHWTGPGQPPPGPHIGYDGPLPPSHDGLVHHYLFTLYALSVARLPVDAPFTGAQVREALAGRVLDAATLSGTYTLNRRLRQHEPLVP